LTISTDDNATVLRAFKVNRGFNQKIKAHSHSRRIKQTRFTKEIQEVLISRLY